jgi:CubicO group peptidase (beta-lactamase class C family)
VPLRSCSGTVVSHKCVYVSVVPLLIYFLLSSIVMIPLRITHTAPASALAGNLSDLHDLQTFLDRTLSAQLKNNHIPGATISVVKGGSLLFAKGYGNADLQHGKQVSATTTLFRIASVSKLFTWTAVMQLAEQGKVDLHIDINHYLKTFQIPATYPQPITLAHLLTYTAGFEEKGGADTTNPKDLEPLGTWLASHIPTRVHPPGELASYSNYNAALAGYIVEQVSGLSFDHYIEEHIYRPLGMSYSTFRQPIPISLSANQAKGYTYKGGSYQTTPFQYLLDAPAGAMNSTATDMAKFMIAHLQDGRLGNTRILQAATVQDMHRRHFTNDPRIPGMAYGFYENSVNNQQMIAHGGDITSFHSYILLLPHVQVGLFVSYNSDGGMQARESLIQAFFNRYFPGSQMTIPKPPAGFAEREKWITGSYWPTERAYTTYEKMGVLFSTITVQAQGNGRIMISGLQPTFTGVEVKPWLFRQVNGSALIAFQVRSNETIMLHNNTLGSYTMIAWYDTPMFHLMLVSLLLLFFLSVFLLWGVIRLRSVGKPHYSDTRSYIARWMAFLVGIVNVLILLVIAFFLWLVLSQNFQGIIIFGQSGRIVLFTLALASAILTIGVVVCATLMWNKRDWGRVLRIHYTLVALAALAFI